MKQNSVKKNARNGLTRIALFSALILSGVTASATELLNSSYDVSRELFTALNPGFQAQWEQQNPGDKLTIKQSHAGSSKQALAILQGLKADVVTYNQITDVQILHDRGNLIPADWQARLPNNSSPFYSTMAFLVRKGNPKNIRNWDDLVREDVKLVFPNPKTSGNGRYTYLAAWGATQLADGGDEAKTRDWMKRFLKNVEVFDTGGRGATTTFVERGLGDVLISFESEVNNIRKEYGSDQYEVIVPPVDILAEFPVAWVDKNVEKNGTEKAAKAYLNYLYSPPAQQVITRFNYRVYDKAAMEAAKSQFPDTKLFRVEDQFGSWPQVMSTHFTTGGVLDKLLAEGHQ
ncbi:MULTISPECIES: sulfate ABC transporter substrate-binding protein [Yersinia pseudotuberculosis complex]|uniref:Sulfate/thiosulfate ABC transporter, periplasmic sulfate/thiosulfate-binding protein n=1 Tax=Yersinia pseudotuberculosis serotype O:1b (strain IP 31758) TaxID=349747 RepID=A0A0U1QV82_YERP3|nr:MULTISPECIES: sulfate ABC transporter substrate-binding protein [Yersinia pseudotuberculosis complex]ABS46393.1 sulfate/thiosulfate ABC transporter, periplasmic sulfate/thiosulfate-binding protein [Yersinia pseudotuberculosis IP 31758]AJK16686.1 sulfate ABC transporter, sulfate-binding family protein [Yersinia pseudotuberculosis str. PA3606]MCE4114663.1 sulfate ABC transporter substrate-binding protein [Yersinia pseudotuberculosis]MCF1164803.1 sulfate ABC transporter substrate-binding protei